MKKLLLLLALAATLALAGCAKDELAATDGATTGVTDSSVSSGGYGAGGVSGSGVSDPNAAVYGVPAPGLTRIYFAYDQFGLTDEAKRVLEANAAYLKGNGMRVTIEGHCDERGSDEYNLALGQKRALAVKSYLVSLGVAGDRLSVISYGEERPMVPGHDESAWAQNRRAEFVIQ